ncbi:MAG: hypothetical protein PHN69_04440 [Candidatus Pacebacteria bacterium]|nr:hypothetical protein [Candidatus Paceibacterota bacterium]
MKLNYGLVIKTLTVAAILGIPYLVFVGHMEPIKALFNAFPGLFMAGLAWLIWNTDKRKAV